MAWRAVRGQRNLPVGCVLTTFALPSQVASSVSPHTSPFDDETSALRGSLDKLLSSYVSNHYSSGVAAVYTLPDPAHPPPEPALASAEQQTATEPEGTGETGSIAEDVEGGKEEVADAAADTAEEVEKALPDEGVETVGGEGAAPTGTSAEETEAQVEAEDKREKEEEAEEDDKMDVGTPAAAVVEAQEEAPASATEEAAPEPPQPRPSRLFGLYFVGNKYNPNNYWCVREQMPCHPGPERPVLTSGSTVSRAGLAGGARRTSSTMPRARSKARRRSTSTTTSRVRRVVRFSWSRVVRTQQLRVHRCRRRRQRPALDDAQVVRQALALPVPRVGRRLDQGDRVVVPAPARRDVRRPVGREFPRAQARAAQDEEQARLGQGDGYAAGSAD